MAEALPGARPTLLSSCAQAATMAEARFRVPYPNATTRNARVVALDAAAAELMREIAREPWRAARFYRLAPQPDVSPNEVTLVDLDGLPKLYSTELAGADVVVLIATTSAGARAAETIGRLARDRAVMTAGIVVAGAATDAVVAAMRPSAAVLVIAGDSDYLLAMLSALRA